MKTIKEITGKYLELIDKESPWYALEQLFMWVYDEIPCKYWVKGNTIGSVSINLTEKYKDPVEGLVYDIKELYESLKNSDEYLGLLETPYHGEVGRGGRR